MNETPTTPSDNATRRQVVLPCPWCDKIPNVETRSIGHQMGQLKENRFGKKFDPLAGQNFTTDFRCSDGCLGNVNLFGTWLNSRGDADYDLQVKTLKNEAVYKWNDRALPSDLILNGAESWVDEKRKRDERQKLRDAIEFERSG